METRTSNGLDQFCTWLEERPGMAILDLMGANQNTISYVTNLGHSVYSDDLLLQLDQAFGGDGNFYENQTNHHRVADFLESALNFPDSNFDGVLLWDTLEFLAPSVLEAFVRRLHRIVRPGSCLLALFHAQERHGAVRALSYRISDHKHILMVPRGERQAGHFFNNRALEKMFQDFESVKFFLTRDHLREVIIRR